MGHPRVCFISFERTTKLMEQDGNLSSCKARHSDFDFGSRLGGKNFVILVSRLLLNRIGMFAHQASTLAVLCRHILSTYET
jgi:hypothetical protein